MTTQPADRALFTWRNCYGDVIATRFDTTIRKYWDKIASPALKAAENEVAHWENSEEDSAVFVLSIVEDDLAITASAFCLSLQSIWERQLRAYLIECDRAANRHASNTTEIRHAYWGSLQNIFHRVRGVPMTLFTSYHDLDLLSRLANVCRHGDGKTADALWKSHPALWPDHCTAPVLGFPAPVSAPPASMIRVTRALLEQFVDAIECFWVMLDYLYLESLQNKVPHVERQLETNRQTLAAEIAFFNKGLATLGG